MNTAWVPPDEAFGKLLAQLDPDLQSDEERYDRFRSRLIYFLRRRGCADPAEQASETISRVCQQLSKGAEVRNLSAYCHGVAKLVLLESLRRPESEELDETISEKVSIDPRKIEREKEWENHRLDCMRGCLKKLSEDDRHLITSYADEDSDSEQKAKRAGITVTALRMRISRIRSGLRECQKRCVEKS